MPDNKIKFMRWSLGLVILLSYVLKNTWQARENYWAYWVSRFLFGGELAIFGMAFLFFPKFMLQVCSNEDLSDIPTWKVRVIGLIAGIPFTVWGIYFVSIVIRSWLILGCHWSDCLFLNPLK